MNHLHTDLSLQDGDVVEVELDGRANVMLMDTSNYDAYKHGRPYRYSGGHATESPVRIPAPRGGDWHLVIDLGGHAGHVSAGLTILRAVEDDEGDREVTALRSNPRFLASLAECEERARTRPRKTLREIRASFDETASDRGGAESTREP